MKKLLGLLLLLGMVVVLAGVACGGDDDDGDDAGGDATGTAVETEAGDATDGAEETDAGDDGGEDADPELVEYFAAVEDIAARTNSELDAVNDRLSSETYASEEAEVAANVEAFNEVGVTLETSAIAMSELEAPDSVSSEHDAFTQALISYTQSLAEITADLDDVVTLEDLNVVLDAAGASVNEAIDEAMVTCLALEARGVEEVGDVDLDCPGDG